MADKFTVIREVAAGVWTFSRPFARLGIFPVGGRSTAVKLTNGGVWVLASTALNPETKAKLDELGPVQYIISADAVHHLFLGALPVHHTKGAYNNDHMQGNSNKRTQPPSSSAPQLPSHAPTKSSFSTACGVRTRPTPNTALRKTSKHGDYFSGFKNKDVAFFHPASKTMIQADLLFNLPCTEQYSKTKSSGSLPLLGALGPTSWLHQKFGTAMGEDKAAMKRDVKTVTDWDFTRIIPCHGDVIETGGKQAWLEAYKAYLDPA
ncbi:hypothetical protein MSAN_02388600 [Mycena sanguinolenta]|uniref:DUF4336 domain-containing protein n=1 Tax=Mycena sanguinolenta TaxID=230812 RepID=A0A8H7CEH0_9AGAR|nr:hypothetical protein MSAN_02388600 [Mycena sanguinolenta]